MGKIGTYINRNFKKWKATSFTVFIVFSFLLWFLIKFSETYSGSISLNIEYINIPEDKIVLGTPPEKIDVRIRTQGFQMLYYRIFSNKISLDVSTPALTKNQLVFSRNYIQDRIRQQLKEDVELQQMEYEKISLKVGINKRKQLPVIHQLAISFKNDFELEDSLTIQPSTVTVIGPEDVLDTLRYLKTRSMSLNNIDENIDAKVPLLIPAVQESLKLSHDEVRIKGKVSRFSERLIKVPVSVINAATDTEVILFPSEIEILCRASIDYIKEIRAENFRIVCDMEEAGVNSNYLIPKIVKSPETIKEINLLNKKIEYLIKRQ